MAKYFGVSQNYINRESGDLNGDNRVDVADLEKLANEWLQKEKWY